MDPVTCSETEGIECLKICVSLFMDLLRALFPCAASGKACPRRAGCTGSSGVYGEEPTKGQGEGEDEVLSLRAHALHVGELLWHSACWVRRAPYPAGRNNRSEDTREQHRLYRWPDSNCHCRTVVLWLALNRRSRHPSRTTSPGGGGDTLRARCCRMWADAPRRARLTVKHRIF